MEAADEAQSVEEAHRILDRVISTTAPPGPEPIVKPNRADRRAAIRRGQPRAVRKWYGFGAWRKSHVR